ncbi:MAG: YkgJ family cysteine cluster protein [Planctomycetota bacterium]|nr:YkgJ family cysteine cluster protein [Planctomycetota bacterium]MDP6761364.1 YkgJ family cysteine cluster protein [Planctomycetota bacterium]MDP6990264.1 YkgJ family cysteine cluster protein [Planctomycetota bacterium]
MSSKPWYSNGLRFSCTSCGNCCRTHGEHAYIYLAEADVRAIARHLGLSRARFLTEHCDLEEGWVVLRTTEPDCPFLDHDRRCSIYAVRPRQCASWPFWEENLDRARWEGVVREVCPGIGRGPLHSAAEVERLARETEEWYGEESTLGRDRQG